MQQSSLEQLSTVGNLPPVKMPQMLNSGRSSEMPQTSDGITLVSRHAYRGNQQQQMANNMASTAAQDNSAGGDSEMISWPSRGGATQNQQ